LLLSAQWGGVSGIVGWGVGVNRVAEGGQCSSFIVNGITVM